MCGYALISIEYDCLHIFILNVPILKSLCPIETDRVSVTGIKHFIMEHYRAFIIQSQIQTFRDNILVYFVLMVVRKMLLA